MELFVEMYKCVLCGQLRDEMDRILKHILFHVSYNNYQVHPFLGNHVCPTACGSGGTNLMPALSPSFTLCSYRGLTYHLPMMLTITLGSLMATKSLFLVFNIQMLERRIAHFFEFTKHC